MSKVILQGPLDPSAAPAVEAAVQRYAEANPAVAQSDHVVLTVADADGNPCEVTGSFQRDLLGNIIFVVVSGLLKRLVKKLKARTHASPREQRRNRKERLRGQSAMPATATSLGDMPEDAEGRYRYFKGAGLLRKERNGSYRMAGGLNFPNKEAVLAHLVGAAQEEATDAAPQKATQKPSGKGKKAGAAGKGGTATKEPADVLAKLLAKGTLTLQVGMYRHTDGRKWRGKVKVLEAIAAGELKK